MGREGGETDNQLFGLSDVELRIFAFHWFSFRYELVVVCHAAAERCVRFSQSASSVRVWLWILSWSQQTAFWHGERRPSGGQWVWHRLWTCWFWEHTAEGGSTLAGILSLTFIFTFTFRAFSRRFCPKRLTTSIFVTREKLRHITVDGAKTKYRKQPSSPHLRVVAAICQRFSKCISAITEVLTIWTYKCIPFLLWVEMESEQLSLLSFVGDGEWFRCPDIGRTKQRGVAVSLSGLCLLSAMAVPAVQLM